MHTRKYIIVLKTEIFDIYFGYEVIFDMLRPTGAYNLTKHISIWNRQKEEGVRT
jgi:hypothetical protein